MYTVNVFYVAISLLLSSTLALNLQPTSYLNKQISRQLSKVIIASSLLFGASDAMAATTKLTNLEPSEMVKIVAGDISDRQALITADFTRDIYSETATFQDEIDTYPMDKYVSGTKALFNKDKSHVDLVGEVTASAEGVDFRLG
jgi:hypothetical protein